MVPRSRQSHILQNSFSCLAAATLVYAFRAICAFKRYQHCASALIHQLSDCFEWCLRAKRIPTNGMRLKSFNPKTVFHRTDKVLLTFFEVLPTLTNTALDIRLSQVRSAVGILLHHLIATSSGVYLVDPVEGPMTEQPSIWQVIFTAPVSGTVVSAMLGLIFHQRLKSIEARLNE